MKKRRLIPVILLKNGYLVQSKSFQFYQNIGNPVQAVKRLSQWGSDELIYLDISGDDKYDIERDDLNYKNTPIFLDIIKKVSKVTFMPITVGGKIKNLLDAEKRLAVGADKISVNSAAIENPDFIINLAKEFGSQCVVISVDVKIIDNKYKVLSHGGTKISNYELEEYINIVEKNGAGEILVNSIDRDGLGIGYDLNLLNMVTDRCKIPVIACGGVGKWQHFSDALSKTKVDAVSAANIFWYTDQSIYLSKKYLYEQKHNIRKPDLIEI